MSGNLILIRGLPGSGKTTKAKQIMENLESVDVKAVHFEADMYFVGPDGVYRFDAKKLQLAHDWCKYNVNLALIEGTDVIVSNTFTTMKEMKPYMDMHSASLAIFECKGDYGSIHDVPEKSITRMKSRWEELNTPK